MTVDANAETRPLAGKDRKSRRSNRSEEVTAEERKTLVNANSSERNVDVTHEEKAEEMEPALTEDIYSLIYTGNPYRPAFWFASLVFIMQLGLLAAIIVDLTDPRQDNWAKRPSAIPFEVFLAQNLCLVLIAITVAVTGDITIGLDMLLAGYDESILQTNPWATFGTWLIAIVCQMSVGILMTSVFFFLLIQSTTVIGMTLNFAALQFIQEIDELSFRLGLNGYLGSSILEDCQRVTAHMIPKSKRQYGRVLRPTIFVTLLIVLFVPYYTLFERDFQCDLIQVQFGDGFDTEYGYLSGVFERRGQTRRVRPIYVDNFDRAKFSYCERMKQWTLSFVGEDECDQPYMKSPTTEEYDLFNLNSETWMMFDPETFQYSPADRLYMRCAECDDNRPGGNCGQFEEGFCSDLNGKSVCECEEGFVGTGCEFSLCEKLELDPVTQPFPDVHPLFSGKYEVLRNSNGTIVESHQRPIYASVELLRPDLQVGRGLLIYFGRRWAMTWDIFFYRELDACWKQTNSSVEHLPECAAPTLDDLTSFLSNTFQPLQATSFQLIGDFAAADDDDNDGDIDSLDNLAEGYIPYFFSAPIDVGTPTDAVSPADVTWFPTIQPLSTFKNYRQYLPDELHPLDSLFVCSSYAV